MGNIPAFFCSFCCNCIMYIDFHCCQAFSFYSACKFPPPLLFSHHKLYVTYPGRNPFSSNTSSASPSLPFRTFFFLPSLLTKHNLCTFRADMLELLERMKAGGTSCWRFADISHVMRLAERLMSALKGYNTMYDTRLRLGELAKVL